MSIPGSPTPSVAGPPHGLADRMGMWAAVACALHCAMLPLLIGVLPLLGLGFLAGVGFDRLFAVFATLVGVLAVAGGFRRHRATWVWWLLLAGLVLIWANSTPWLHAHTVPHAVMMTTGGVLVALAHWFNFRLSRHACKPVR